MIPFIDLQTQRKRIESGINQRIHAVLEHGQFIQGKEVRELEACLAEYIGAKYSVGVANGTDALLLALMALDIKAGDEVIVPDFSFYATAEIVQNVNATPVFVEINPKTYNIDVKATENAITKNTKAIIPVSLYGQPAELIELDKLGQKHNIAVIEDAAQSFGGIHHGKKSASINTISCTSFFPSKPLGCYGDGGACFTNDEALATKLRELREHGQSGRYLHTSVGLNSRLDSLQAAILLEKMTIFENEMEERQEVAARYSEGLKDLTQVPYIEAYNRSAYAQYTIRVDNRDQVQEYLKGKGVPTAVHYPCTLSNQPVLSKFKKETLPHADKAAKEVLSLPFSPYLSTDDQAKVIEEVRKAIEQFKDA